MQSRPAPQPALTFEYLMWLLIRISGLGLYALAIIGVIAALSLGARTQVDMGSLIRWTFFPNSGHVANTGVDLELGWVSVLWQVLQGTAVVFGVTHGINGLRNVLEDYISKPGTRMIVRIALFVLWALFLYAAFTLVLSDKL
jgi:succinate dehydrogenase hydrophobic anchor subunit